MWLEPTAGQARAVVSLVTGQPEDTVLVASCGGRVAAHRVLLALHSPLLAGLLEEAGEGAGLSLPLPLPALRGLLGVLEGEEAGARGEVAAAMRWLATLNMTARAERATRPSSLGPVELPPPRTLVT